MRVSKQSVDVLYTNYRTETRWRVIIPISISFGRNEWHPEEQWLLHCWDCEKEALRVFAVADISRWGKKE